MSEEYCENYGAEKGHGVATFCVGKCLANIKSETRTKTIDEIDKLLMISDGIKTTSQTLEKCINSHNGDIDSEDCISCNWYLGQNQLLRQQLCEIKQLRDKE